MIQKDELRDSRPLFFINMLLLLLNDIGQYTIFWQVNPSHLTRIKIPGISVTHATFLYNRFSRKDDHNGEKDDS